tara:strand:+ start:571 stop:1044 length:474 start_codon:yes stop_codon:yes gene_type:complete
VAYNSSLTNAVKYIEFVPGASDFPTATVAGVMWDGAYVEIFGLLTARGITIGSGDNSEKAARDIEALLTSHKVGAVAFMQSDGKIDAYTEWLKTEAMRLLGLFLDPATGYEYAEGLGASITRKGPRVDALPVSYPNDDQDLTDLENPLEEFTVEGDI